MSELIETDSRSRVVIPGHSNERFVVRENADGIILLQPARIGVGAPDEGPTVVAAPAMSRSAFLRKEISDDI